MERLYTESVIKCNKSKKIYDTKKFFNTEGHHLKESSLILLKLLEKHSIIEPQIKINNEEIKFYWSNENNNIDFIIQEENIYKIKINTEDKFVLKNTNSVFDNIDDNIIYLLKKTF